MKQKKTVLVLFGGVSSEHEISCLSAASVLSHMDIDKYEIRKAGITSIVVTDESTGLMDGIYDLTACGCTMGSLRTVTRADDFRFGSREPETKRGIGFKIS